MEREDIEKLNGVKPYSFETEREQEWYEAGLVEGLDVADSERDKLGHMKSIAKELDKWLGENEDGRAYVVRLFEKKGEDIRTDSISKGDRETMVSGIACVLDVKDDIITVVADTVSKYTADSSDNIAEREEEC